MSSTDKLNKKADNTQPWHNHFPLLNQSIVPCPNLTIASWPTYRFLRRQAKWSDIPISENFPQFVVIYTKCFTVVTKAKVDVFLEFPCFFYVTAYSGNLISGSSAFSKSILCIWKFLVHVLLKPSLKDSGHYLASMFNKCKFMVVGTFFGIALLWDWNENWSFPVLWPLFSFPKFTGILSVAL